MKAFKYMKIDLNRVKTQMWFMLLFGGLAYAFSKSAGNILSGTAYLLFAATIMQGAVFTYEQKNEIGFVNLLPGTDLDRISGRFMMGTFLIIYGAALGAVVAVILHVYDKLEIHYLPEILIAFLGVGLMYMAIQNVLFYIIGKGNSQQLMSFLHMLPGFIMWFVSYSLISILSVGEAEMMQKAADVLVWIQTHSMLAALSVLAVGIVFIVAGIFITEKIISKKDFA